MTKSGAEQLKTQTSEHLYKSNNSHNHAKRKRTRPHLTSNHHPNLRSKPKQRHLR